MGDSYKIIKTTSATMSGTIQMFLQGVSIRTWKQRFNTGCTYKVYGGDPIVTRLSGSFGDDDNFFNDSWASTAPGVFTNTAMETRLSYDMLRLNYGQSYEFNPSTPFVDIQPPTLASVILHMESQRAPAYPAVLSSKSSIRLGQMDGVIEPLDIRRPIDRAMDFYVSSSSDSAHRPRASVTSMFTETYYGNVEISQFTYIGKDPSHVIPFLDMQDMFLTASAPLPGTLMPKQQTLVPFKDFTEDEYKWRDYKEHDSEMKAALYELTGSSSESILPRDKKSSGAGFTYRVNPLGTDSIAFGGWIK